MNERDGRTPDVVRFQRATGEPISESARIIQLHVHLIIRCPTLSLQSSLESPFWKRHFHFHSLGFIWKRNKGCRTLNCTLEFGLITSPPNRTLGTWSRPCEKPVPSRWNGILSVRRSIMVSWLQLTACVCTRAHFVAPFGEHAMTRLCTCIPSDWLYTGPASHVRPLQS